MHPTRVDKIIHFVKGSNAECCQFSPDGQLLATGSGDGFVEVRGVVPPVLISLVNFFGGDNYCSVYACY